MSEIKTSAKHVVIFDRRPSDGGSIPPASTKFLHSVFSWFTTPCTRVFSSVSAKCTSVMFLNHS